MNRHQFAKGYTDGVRNRADMVNSVLHGLAPDLHDELLAMATNKQTTMTILGYVARFPYDQQRAMFDLFQDRGSRYAKRYVESLTTPPSRATMARRIAGFVDNEFPLASRDDLAEALRTVAEAVATAET